MKRHVYRLTQRRYRSSAFAGTGSLRRSGRWWFDTGCSVVLEVPSAVLPSASNYLLNPTHPRFEEIVLGPPEPFSVDPRLGN